MIIALLGMLLSFAVYKLNTTEKTRAYLACKIIYHEDRYLFAIPFFGETLSYHTILGVLDHSMHDIFVLGSGEHVDDLYMPKEKVYIALVKTLYDEYVHYMSTYKNGDFQPDIQRLLDNHRHEGSFDRVECFVYNRLGVTLDYKNLRLVDPSTPDE